ncbi:hypothetical protein ASPWEDRAFT_294336 [Aspergillus wentii DTO 134E9]|uniref:Cofilin n=1 Tax=Aspergillus wentii DTO 134E9 TaxID=1073089 RepID=A0A1L9R438_ASPWE|nr:uncharacterized protein ASPWEDRAFT_294336 [Aspergillus wentii DTO 134E9]OJJ29670.1 hypothetical protein ASPWEDRAFT_294336 [Aspergillus wentii DTO 134E9]
MSIPSGVSISDECITAFNQLRSGRGANRLQFIIFKLSDNQQVIEVDESSTELDYEAFRQKLSSAVDNSGKPAPRYAVYDVEFDLHEDGKRRRTVFISWVPDQTPVKLCMIHASTKEQLKNALDIKLDIHADKPDEIDWKVILNKASGGKA